MLDTSRFLSASRQNLLRLSWIRVLVLFAQAGTLAAVYLSELLSLPWKPLL